MPGNLECVVCGVQVVPAAPAMCEQGGKRDLINQLILLGYLFIYLILLGGSQPAAPAMCEKGQAPNLGHQGDGQVVTSQG